MRTIKPFVGFVFVLIISCLQPSPEKARDPLLDKASDILKAPAYPRPRKTTSLHCPFHTTFRKPPSVASV